MSFGTDPTLTIDGKKIPVRLTLGGLAEIEEAIGAESLSDLARILSNPSVKQILAILPVLIRAGGGTTAVASVAEGTIHLGEAMRVLAQLFRGLIGGDLPGKPNQAGSDGVPG